MKDSIEIITTPNFSILINGLPHLILLGKVIGVHSYIDDTNPIGRYCIEFNSSKISSKTTYKDRELWVKILSLINETLNG